jgi:hypothetical protein
MKKIVILLGLFMLCSGTSFSQSKSDTIDVPTKHTLPLTIYMAPILDGAAFALEYNFNPNLAINFYALKRKSEDASSSVYYGTKSDENLYELFLKITPSHNTNKKLKFIFGPCIGYRKITFDERFFNFREFGGPPFQTGDINAKAKAKFIVPMYFGFDFKSKRGMIFEFASGLSYQKSEGNTRLSGPVITPYSEGLNLRSRFLFGYTF